MIKKFDIYKPFDVVFFPERDKKYVKITPGGSIYVCDFEKHKFYPAEERKINLKNADKY